MNILFIDDEYARTLPIVEFLQLSTASANQVVLKSKIGEAYHYFQQHKDVIDIIILDVMMPIYDDERHLFDSNNNVVTHSAGISLWEKLSNEMIENRHMPIALLTARMDILKEFPHFRDLINEGKIVILIKPILMDELETILTKMFADNVNQTL